jgi:hypothetical protein
MECLASSDYRMVRHTVVAVVGPHTEAIQRWGFDLIVEANLGAAFWA